MQKLFWKIYGAILVSTLIILIISYYAFSAFNDHRYQTHLKEIMSGTNHLLSRGINRQQGENQARWLSLSSSLMNTQLEIKPANAIGKPPKLQIKKVKAKSDGVEQFILYHPLNNKNWLLTKLDGYTEQLASASAFLLLNELGRTPAAMRQATFNDIKQQFSYAIYRSERQDLNLDSQQIERLERGETVVEWHKQFGRALAINVYAPWGKTTDVLVLDNIQLFDPYPIKLITVFFIMSLLLIAISVFLIIKHLTRQLHQLEAKVDAISPEYTVHQQPNHNPDAINQLNNKIHAMAQRIEKLLDEKAYMIRAVSHDLRTPVAKLHFRLETLSMLVNKDNAAILGCKSDLKQLNLLIDELLTYEKLSDKTHSEFSTINLIDLVKEQISSNEILSPNLNISLNNEASDNLYLVGDPSLLSRLFTNILNNAGRYARQKIVLSITEKAGHAIIHIDDDGCGLDEDITEQIFSPFFRAESSRNSQLGGYGIGLAIVKQIAKQHYFQVSASNNQWQGARFTLVCPLESNGQNAGKCDHG